MQRQTNSSLVTLLREVTEEIVELWTAFLSEEDAICRTASVHQGTTMVGQGRGHSDLTFAGFAISEVWACPSAEQIESTCMSYDIILEVENGRQFEF